MADYEKIYHGNDCSDDNLMHAHLHMNRKYHYCIVAIAYEFCNLTIEVKGSFCVGRNGYLSLAIYFIVILLIGLNSH